MIKKLIARLLPGEPGPQIPAIELCAECRSCPIFKEKIQFKGRYADAVTASSTIYSDYQLARLRQLGPQIYKLRIRLIQCTPEQRSHAAGWLAELEDHTHTRSLIIAEALGLQASTNPVDEPPANW